MSFAVVNTDTSEVIRTFAGDAVPDPVVWPNGDATHAAYPGYQHAQWRFVNITYGPDSPGEFYENTAVNISISGDTLTYVRTWTLMSLAYVQQTLSARIDADAEEQRRLYITPGVGQAMVYLQKQVEAQALASDQSPDPAKYPLLSASVGLEGLSISDIAALVTTTATQWMQIAGALEKVRLTTKASIANAKDAKTAIASYDSVTWPNFQPKKS